MANNAREAASQPDAQIVGTWALQISSPFGIQPITFTVARTGGALAGEMRHERGAAAITDIELRGDDFTARAAITLKGSRITADVQGHIAGTQMTGTVKVHIPLAPAVKFSGQKTSP